MRHSALGAAILETAEDSPRDSWYNGVQYVRRQSRKKLLEQVDIKLLAYIPHVFGPTVFGRVKKCGHGWRWSFACAGVAVHSGVFASESDAQVELASAPNKVHCAWPDPSDVASLLRHVYRRHEDAERLGILANTTTVVLRAHSYVKPRVHCWENYLENGGAQSGLRMRPNLEYGWGST